MTVSRVEGCLSRVRSLHCLNGSEEYKISTQEKARQNATEQRQHQQHRQQSMLERSEAEVAAINDAVIQEESRELLAKQRQKAEHRTLSMQYRSEEEMLELDAGSHPVKPK